MFFFLKKVSPFLCQIFFHVIMSKKVKFSFINSHNLFSKEIFFVPEHFDENETE